MADDKNAGVPATVVKPRKTPTGYTGSSGFWAIGLLVVLTGSIGYASWASLTAQQHPAMASTPQQLPSSQPSAGPVADPTDPPAPSPRPSVRVSASVQRTVAVVMPTQYSAPAPRSTPTLSPEQEYRNEEIVRTLASRRASSVVKLSQDDQARQDLAGAYGSNQSARPTMPPATSAPILFSSDNSSVSDRFTGQHRTSIGYVTPVSEDQVDAGTPIQAVTSFAVDSTFPDGTVSSMITSPVFSSRHGHNVIVIPQGTKLLVTYNSHTTQGEARLQSVGTRLVFEDGREFDLGGSSQGAGMQGEVGMPAVVDTHAGRRFGNAVLSSLLQSVVSLSSRANTNINLGSVNAPQPQQLSPTMHIKAGTPFTFVVGEDLPLTRYEVQ